MSPSSPSPSSPPAGSAAQGAYGTAPGPVRLSEHAHAALRPADRVRITGGFWHERRRTNADVSIPQGPTLLESAGNLHNLRLAAGTVTGDYHGDLPFLDTDVTKWLEAAAWHMADPDTAGAEGFAQAGDVDKMIRLLAEAQQDNGYLQSYYQVVKPGLRFAELRWGHELYCAGHLIQAAVAHHRATGATELLDVARRFADHVDATFGADKAVDGVCGHPVIETALVELYRETGERRYLDLAGYFVDRRGRGLLDKEDDGRRGFGPGLAYFQDHVPLRDAQTVAGHAVRQLYLLAGAADIVTETGEPRLRAAVERLWEEMTRTKTYLTGGIGSRHEWESFGEAYELPPDRGYCETCASVASIQFSWRMALLTGRARYSDLVERTLYNSFLSGVSQDGLRWLYVNPLQVRDDYRHDGGDHGARRTQWFRCSCCPPNVMRLLASLPHYLVSTDADGLQVHQYATGSYAGRGLAVRVETDYPWQGRIALTVTQAPEEERTISLRIPQWCEEYTLSVAGDSVDQPTRTTRTAEPTKTTRAAETAEDGWLRIRRHWRSGDTLVLELAMEPRLVAADHRVDAVRGCVAIECGPLVHCLEQADQPGAVSLGRVVLDTSQPLTSVHRPDLLGGINTVTATGYVPSAGAPDWWPYAPVAGPRRATTTSPGSATAPGGTTPPGGATASTGNARISLTAVPYYAWANRDDGGMRVWIPAD